MSEEQKKTTPDDLSKTTDENKVELNEEELGKASGGGQDYFLKLNKVYPSSLE